MTKDLICHSVGAKLTVSFPGNLDWLTSEKLTFSNDLQDILDEVHEKVLQNNQLKEIIEDLLSKVVNKLDNWISIYVGLVFDFRLIES